MSDSIPMYQLSEPAFIAPHMLPAGSKVETKRTPSRTWIGLNKAAIAALDELYEKVVEVRDHNNNLVETKPNLSFKYLSAGFEPDEEPVRIVSGAGAVAPATSGTSLAEAQAGRAEDAMVTDDSGVSRLRAAQVEPTVAAITQPPPVDVAESGDKSLDGEVTVVEAAPVAPKPITPRR